ncbi:hypothetical protein ACFQX4_23795 [Roseomonas sp. GCM10028921]
MRPAVDQPGGAAEILDRPVRPGLLAAPPADLLRALDALRPRDEVALRAILVALGHELAAAAAPARPRPDGPKSVADSRSSSTTASRREEPEAAIRNPVPSEIVVQLPADAALPPWMADAALLPLSGEPGAVLRAPMPPLLAPRRQRALLAHAAARPLPMGEIDLERVARDMAELRPLTTLPRRLVASLQGGAQLLCDAGPGMEPFALDVQMLTRLVLVVVGRDRVRIERFIGCPSRGLLRWENGRPGPYRSPATGQPVLAISDLGSIRVPGAAGRSDEWLAFDAALRRRGSSLTVLFPGAARRVPAPLRGRLRVIPLDRATGVRQAASRTGHPPTA